jgi:tRNA A-37 threonylcarbamoyl transferase component Bud32/tetratricopeptide (TPR) repeat protein
MSLLIERVRATLGAEYEVERELAAGGMGVVFLGRERALDRAVAIKILRPEQATAIAAERFQREARLLAAVTHPNVVTIHRVGEAGGLFYLVMERLEGTLAGRLGRGAMPAGDAVRMARDVLEGLARVHDRGIVHRDIKPSNIFLRDDGRAVLGDFGIARSLASGDGLTATGLSPGTPAYMAPEQFVSSEVGPVADLYALGMVCFEAVTGRRWSAGDPMKGDWQGVPGRLRPVLQRALALEPENRWPDARMFARALRATQHTTGVQWVVAASATAVAATGILVLVWPRAVERSDVAVLPFAVEGGSPQTGEALAAWVELNLKHAFVDSGLSVTPEALSAPWADQLAPEANLPRSAWDDLHTDRIVRGRVRVAGDSLEVNASLVGRDGTMLAEAHVTAHRTDLQGIGHRVGLAVVQVVHPALASRYAGAEALSDIAAATHAFVSAEGAFQRDNWTAADSLYREAITLDSSLALAWWGLFNARRWQRAPPGVDLAEVYARHAGRFDDLERRLIEAELAQTVPERLAIYAEAIKRFPWNAYPRLLRGNELFHRGALAGRGLDSAIAELRRAAEENPYLAATWDMLTWAYTRAGDGGRARDAIEIRKRLGQAQPVEDFVIPVVLELAVDMRFLPPDEAQRKLKEVMNSPGGQSSLVHAVRLGLSFGLPEAQLLIGRALAAAPDAAIQVQGLTTQALALLALGRPSDAVALFEHVARISGDEEYGFQAAQWRLILPALGLPGIGDAARDSARARLAEVTDTLRVGRARWTLLVDAVATGDASANVDSPRADGGAGGLARLGIALRAAADGDTAAALAITDTLVLRGLHADLEDPLQRAVLFLARGHWLADRDPGAADLAYRWYENADFSDWPRGHPQAAELDWALEAYARYLRATLDGDDHDRCASVPVARRWWQSADTAFAPLQRALEQWEGSCRAS